MINWLLTYFREYPKQINRRAGIECELLDIANGKRPLPSREDCRVMALKLGTPREYWLEEWK